MKNFDLKDAKILENEDVFIIKNLNNTLGFVRFNEIGEFEYIFVNRI